MSHHASTSNNNDKAEPITKEEWQSRLESFEFTQADMNKLIMNYLVTGKMCNFFFYSITHFSQEFTQLLRCSILQRGSKKQLKNFK